MADIGGRDPFRPPRPPTWDGGPEFGTLVESLRRVQDLVGGTNPPVERLRQARERLDELAELLEPFQCEEIDLIAGRRIDLPSRGHPLLPPFVFDEQDGQIERGRVRFTQFYLGGNGAAHGGTLPLFFDDVLGRLSNAGGRSIARTAYLHVNYRAVTPVDRELSFEATFDREEGRKRFVSGRLYDEDTLLADAEGLFVTLLPGQP